MNQIIIENPKGSYKSFEIENDPVWKDYPLKGVTYPVDYGYISGYKSEDDHDLDIFVGSGTINGYIKVWRYDVPVETKVVKDVTDEEWNLIMAEFAPVLIESKQFENKKEFESFLVTYKR